VVARTPRTPAGPPDGALEAEVAVVGAGVAGLYCALCAARAGARVALVSSSPLAASASYWAQGGVAAALADDDSPEIHAADTLAAGRGASRASAVRALSAEASQCVNDLASLGIEFDADPGGELALGLEGGHSRRRVVHAGGSATGRRLMRALAALAARDDRIEVLEEATAGTLVTADDRCHGLVARLAPGGARHPSGAVRSSSGTRAGTGGAAIEVRARGTVLATGGAAALWERTTNPPGAIGTGLSLASRAGAALADLELVQFHPTALASEDGHDGFLLTEALRGEGAVLVNDAGERFVDELAARDEVALAIEDELRSRRGARVLLDMRPVDAGGFPNVVAALAEAGIDPRREPVPVAPAAHYTMGGVATDLEGRSRVPGLFAVGECACTGLHGANRLASNSLAECLVFGRRAAAAAMAEPARRRLPRAPSRGLLAGSPDPLARAPAETRRALWRHAGLVRAEEGLRALADDPFPLARAIAASALGRAESRGAHRRVDRPERDGTLDRRHFVVEPGGALVAERWE
jgi:L-aspartate oxidase